MPKLMMFKTTYCKVIDKNKLYSNYIEFIKDNAPYLLDFYKFESETFPLLDIIYELKHVYYDCPHPFGIRNIAIITGIDDDSIFVIGLDGLKIIEEVEEDLEVEKDA